MPALKHGHDTVAGEPGHGAGRAAGGASGRVGRAGEPVQGEAAGGCAQACGTGRHGRCGTAAAPATRPAGTHDTAPLRPRHGSLGPATRPGQGPRYDHCARLGVHVRSGWACWLGQLGQVGALYTWLSSDSVFDPVLLSTIRESLNEHCSSISFFFEKKKFKLN